MPRQPSEMLGPPVKGGRLLRSIIRAAILWCLLVTPASSWSAEQRGEAELQVQGTLDDDHYLLGQPINVLVKVRNVGSTPFRDLGPLEPSIGRLSLMLEHDGVGQPWTGWRSNVA